MPSRKNKYQIYQPPGQPSDQLQVVLDYFDALKVWDFDGVGKLFTPYFTQQSLPASLGIAARTKAEDIAYLHTVRDSVNGEQLEVCNTHILIRPRSRQADRIQRSSYTMSMRASARFGSTYVPPFVAFGPTHATSRKGYSITY